MTVGLTIPGVETVHPREVWEPNGVDNWYGTWYLNTYGDLRRADAFHRLPAGLDLSEVEYVATHYTSAIDIPDGDPDEILGGVDGIRALLARTQYDYLANRTGGSYRRTRGNTPDGRIFPGYHLGYSFAIDWLGGVWEIQGWSFRPAATSGWNRKALAVLMLTDRADPGSELMWRSHRALSREALRRGARIAPSRVWSHGWFRERTGTGTATGCCGPALEAQIRAGLGDWALHTDNPTEEDSDMTTEPKPYRAYDSRPTEQEGVHLALREQNEAVPKTPLAVGETREIVVGMASEVYVVVTAIGHGNGYISVNDPDGDTSIVGYSDADRVESNGAPALAPGGKITVTAHRAPADVAIDIYAKKP